MVEMGVGRGEDRIAHDLRDIRAEIERVNGRMRLEFSEIHDRLWRLDQRLDDLGARLDRLNTNLPKETAD